MTRIAFCLIRLGIAALTLSGCAGGAAVEAAPATPPASVTATPNSPLPDATESPVATPAPEPGVDSNALTRETAYQLCIDKTVQDQIESRDDPTVDGEPRAAGDYENAMFADSKVNNREDGLVFVYSNLIDHSASADLAEAGATYCLVGGTVSEPTWETYGTVEREFGETLDPFAPLYSME